MEIKGTGHFVPEKILDNHYFASILDTSDEWITERTGIKERRVCDPDKGEFPSYMAEMAAKRALAAANLEANDIDLILFSITIPDMFFPNTSSVLQARLGMTNQCPCLDISAACSGYLYGLTIANSLIETGTYQNILLIGCEMTSRFNNWEDRNTCILFGDGCGATILGPSTNGPSKMLASQLSSDSSKREALILYAGAAQKPITEEVLKNKEQYVTMDGQQVFKAAVKTLAANCENVLKTAELNHEQIDWFIPHQANLRIIEAVAHRFKFPAEKCIINVQKYANTSSASIPIALDEAIRAGKIQRGQNLLMAAFGAGLTAGAAILKY